ncbi:MAG: HAMP domain-containing histidine kinase [Actinobacteria bacterium]|nr:HAMP domain-containing histidine kinase [Actinomycetota bacterium]
MRGLRRLPVRIRLALISASLTFAILLLFAVVIAVFAGKQVRSEFEDELKVTAADLQQKLPVQPSMTGPVIQGDLEAIEAASAGAAAIHIVTLDGHDYHVGPDVDLGRPRTSSHAINGYLVVSRDLSDPNGEVVARLQYGRPLSRVRHTIARIDLFLALGVFGGTALAFLAGLALARRAMAPIAGLTRAARHIARTRDPAVELPKPPAEDEVADLARTLEDMLRALDAARAETEGALSRQREFVADASHELRTPLTSILANLELLEAELKGEEREMADSALRSSRRMRRLVADLLLLARADAGRAGLREAVDLTEIVSEAAAEAAPVSAGHDLRLELPLPGEGAPIVEGVSDDLHRLALNLIENALAHTPPGTEVSVELRNETGTEGRTAVLEVSDAGKGVPPELRHRIFDRFVRGTAEGAGGGSGLGLAIVRAVAERHGGSVELSESEAGGARFTVRLPAKAAPAIDREPARPLRPPAAPSAGA